MPDSRTGGEFPNGGESETLARVDANRRRVLVQWLRDAGFGGCADDLEQERAGTAVQIAYEIAALLDEAYDGEDKAALLWHLRDWADQHDKLGKE